MSTIMTDDYVLGWKPITGLPVLLRVSTGSQGVTGDSAILAFVLEDNAVEAVVDALWDVGQMMLARMAFPRPATPHDEGVLLAGMMEVKIGDYYGYRRIDMPQIYVAHGGRAISLQRELRRLLEEARQFGHAAGSWYREPEQLV